MKNQQKVIEDLQKEVNEGPLDEDKKPIKKAILVKQVADLKKENEDLQDLNKKLQSDLDKTSEDIIKHEGEIEDLKDKNKILNGKLYQDASPEKAKVRQSTFDTVPF